MKKKKSQESTGTEPATDRAIRIFKEALERFQATGNEDGVMQTCNQLGNLELKAGRFEEARGWYEKARTIAFDHGDQEMLGVVVQNLSIVAQQEGERAREAGDAASAGKKLREAEACLIESLAIKKSAGNQPLLAATYGQMARFYLALGDLEQAEKNARRALEICEEHHMPNVWHVYEVLEGISRARRDDASAAGWQRKKEALREELRRQVDARAPAEFVQMVGSLCVAVAQSVLQEKPLHPQVKERLAALKKMPGPWSRVAVFLRTVASRKQPLPEVPEGLPENLKQVLQAMRDQFSL